MDSRKTWGVFLLVAAVVVNQGLGVWAANLAGNPANDGLLGAIYFAKALAGVAVLVGLYFLVSKGKGSAP